MAVSLMRSSSGVLGRSKGISWKMLGIKQGSWGHARWQEINEQFTRCRPIAQPWRAGGSELAFYDVVSHLAKLIGAGVKHLQRGYGLIAQFVGHKLEGRKPSFFTDLVYLLIGPAWVLAKLYRRLGLRW